MCDNTHYKDLLLTEEKTYNNFIVMKSSLYSNNVSGGGLNKNNKFQGYYHTHRQIDRRNWKHTHISVHTSVNAIILLDFLYKNHKLNLFNGISRRFINGMLSL